MLPVKKYVYTVLIPLFAVAMSGYLFLLYTHAAFEDGLLVLTAILPTAILTIAAWGMLLLINGYPTRVGLVLYSFFIGTLFSVLVSYADIVLLRSLANGHPEFIRFISGSAVIHYIITWLVCCWIATFTALQKKNRELSTKFSQQADAAILLREAELYKLRQQLQPHFLYNSLNSISALAMIEPVKAQEMITKLSDFLRSSVKREAQELIPIQEELGYIEAYLSIESVRFGDRLKIEFNKEYTDDALIPPFLLQPLLENAIKFGLYGKTGTVIITVHIVLEAATLLITITNPFDANAQMPKGTGFGLTGVERRLYLLYARTDLLETKQTEEQFTTILKIPQSHV
jgi:two-component system LytT family sensor kinase